LAILIETINLHRQPLPGKSDRTRQSTVLGLPGAGWDRSARPASAAWAMFAVACPRHCQLLLPV